MTKSTKHPSPRPPAARRTRPWIYALLTGAGLLLLAFALTALRPQTPGSAGTPSTQSGGPRLAVEQEVFDYGDVKVGTPIETIFRLRNIGDQPLQLAGNPKVELIEGC